MPIELRDVPLENRFTTVFSAASPAAGISAEMTAATARAPSQIDGRGRALGRPSGLPRQLPGMLMKSDAERADPRAECGAMVLRLRLGIGLAAAFTSDVGSPRG